MILPGHIARLVTCLATDTCLTADPGITSLIPARSHTFGEIDHEIISTAANSRRVVTSVSMCTKYWLSALSSSPRKKVW